MVNRKLPYHLDVERAEQSAARNDILAKDLEFLEGYTYLHMKRNRILEETIGQCHVLRQISQGDDFCAFTFLFPLPGENMIKTRCYISSLTHETSSAMRMK